MQLDMLRIQDRFCYIFISVDRIYFSLNQGSQNKTNQENRETRVSLLWWEKLNSRRFCSHLSIHPSPQWSLGCLYPPLLSQYKNQVHLSFLNFNSHLHVDPFQFCISGKVFPLNIQTHIFKPSRILHLSFCKSCKAKSFSHSNLLLYSPFIQQ